MLLVLFDHRPAYLAGAAESVSAMTLPAGPGCLGQHVIETLTELAGGWQRPPVVVSAAPHAPAQAEGIARAVADEVQVVSATELAGVLAECEPSDEVWLVDLQRWPAELGPARSELAARGAWSGALHLVAVGHKGEKTLERVEFDPEGHVKRVQRYYANLPALKSARQGVFLTVVPAAAVVDLRGGTTLSALRAQLADRGVLSRDVPLEVDACDLTTPSGVMQLNERLLTHKGTNGSPNGHAAHGERIVVAPTAKIAASARLVGPVAVHDRAEIGDNVMLIGPAVVGADARVATSATIAQAVITPGVTIEPRAIVRHQLALGISAETDQPGEATAPVAAPQATGMPAGMATPGPGWLSTPAGLNQPMRLGRLVQLGIKRAADAAVALVALALLAPVLALVALLVKLDSRGPVLFAHRREGLGGKPFPCWKFRTMVANAHLLQRQLYAQNEVDGPQFAMKHDPRITRLGRLLRATNLDELPQLANVLLGHMSLIGPRPSPFRENQICVPWRRARLSVRPGISGLWQVCRSEDRSQGDFHEWIYYDLTYVKHFSLWLDVKILVLTVVTLGGRKSVPMSWLVREPAGAGPAAGAASS